MVDVGQVEVLTYTVSQSDLASELALEDGDAFPAVLATARLVALMELTAARLIRPLLADGQLSVGVVVDITHTAPTPPGASVEVRATYDGLDGKLHRFTIEASDRGGPIGTCAHTRAIVDSAKVVERASKRV
ncbi:MAG: thioesterase [Acidimicrobiia bacterium]|nr:thioesterase [Acidimicrobiia bacterium]